MTSPTAPRLVEWQQIDLMLRGERIAQIAGEEIVRRRAPVSHLAFEFHPGLMLVEGKIQKGFGIPFTVEINRIEASGTMLRVPLARASAFGIPLPMVLLKIAQMFLPPGDIELDQPTGAFLVRLDRFLPPFLDVRVAEVRLVAGGIAVKLGPGGADPPD